MNENSGITAEQAELTARATKAEWFETPDWAVERILEHEILTEHVLDPCAGRGVLGRVAALHGYTVSEIDLNAWPDQPASVRTPVDFLRLSDARQAMPHLPKNGDFSVLMNPPFSKTVDFVVKAMDLGARKVVMFQRLAFMESEDRADFFELHPPARQYVCGSRATCWRGDIPDEDVVVDGDVVVKGRKGRSASTPHAWFVWERGHPGAQVTGRIYRKWGPNPL